MYYFMELHKSLRQGRWRRFRQRVRDWFGDASTHPKAGRTTGAEVARRIGFGVQKELPNDIRRSSGFDWKVMEAVVSKKARGGG